jgi:hypothetical protein
MEKGYIKINSEKGKTPLVEARLINNDLWLTKYDMARLLNCFVPKISGVLKSIFKEQLLWLNDCTYNRRYADNGIEKQCMYYNLEVLIFVSYRINTWEAKIFRQFIKSAVRQQLRKQNTPELYNLLWFSPSCYNQ